MSTATLATFILYLLGMVGIGVWAYFQTRNLSDYILGGRRLGSVVTALSASASDMSGWLLLGLPGAIYFSGLSEMWIVVGLGIGAYFNWKITAPRLRVYTEKAGNAITLPDFFTNRFEDQQNLLRIISASVILVFFTVYVASGLTAGAKLFESSFAMDYHTALWIGAIVIVSYTFVGGFLAVSWTDVIQGLLMVTALVVAPIVIVFQLGGVEPTMQAVQATDAYVLQSCNDDAKSSALLASVPAYNDNDTQKAIKETFQSLCQSHDGKESFRADWFNGQSGVEFIFSIAFLSLMAWGLGYYGQPHLLARFMAAKSVQEVHKARRVAMSWMVVSMVGAVSVGFFAIAYLGTDPKGTEVLFNKESVFIEISQVIFNPWIAGFLLAAILAAVMSTIDSQLLVSSSAITEDIYRAFFNREATDQQLVWIGRGAVLFIAVIAITIASDPTSTVLGLVSNAWAGFGAAFGPVILLSLVWRGMTRNGALAGMITGAVTVIVWIALKDLIGGWFAATYEMIPGVLLATVSIVWFSRTQQPSHAMLTLFDEVQQTLKASSNR